MGNRKAQNSSLESSELPLETKLWQLSMIIAAARKIHSSLALDGVLDAFLDIAMGELGATGGRIYLLDPGSGKLVLRHAKWPREEAESESPVCSSLAISAAKVGKITEEASADGLWTIVNLPLQDESMANIGVLQIDRAGGGILGPGERLFLTELSHFASLSIKNAQYHSDSLEKARLDGEIGVARDIQLRTLPEKMPEVPGYDIVGLSQPAEATNGDSFDLVASSEGKLVMLLADATGHGIGPALSVTQVRSMLRLALRLDADLYTIVKNVNDQLWNDLASNRFVTAFIGLLEYDKHQLSYYSAGQAPLILYRSSAGDSEMLEATCPPLGVMPMLMTTAPAVINFAPGDALALITDGVFEAEDTGGQMFGKERVAEIIKKTHRLSCAETAREIFKGVQRHQGEASQADDITIVLVQRVIPNAD